MSLCVLGNQGDLYSLDPKSQSDLEWHNLTIHGIQARNGHGFASANGKLYVFGGMAGDAKNGEEDKKRIVCSESFEHVVATTFLKAQSWAHQKSPSLPTASLCYDLNDLYVLDPSSPVLSWTDLSSVVRGIAPSSRAYHGFVHEGHKLYVFGGQKIGTGEPVDPVLMSASVMDRMH